MVIYHTAKKRMACDDEEVGMHLATRGDVIKVYPDCCLGISATLLDAVRESLRGADELVLSIGCGSGRFEALLPADLNIRGVEVSASLNKHLPRDRFDTVRDTRALYAEAIVATALMFVYPRPADLVARYVKDVAGGALQKVIILTHRDDWGEVRTKLDELPISYAVLELSGTSAHEIGVALTVV